MAEPEKLTNYYVVAPKKATSTVVFKPSYIPMAKKGAAAGFTRQEMADLFGVTVFQVERWAMDNLEFAEALAGNSLRADTRVRQSLYEKAIGYKRTVTKVFNNGPDTAPTVVEFEEEMPPDTQAAVRWLECRDPTHWQPSQSLALTGPDGEPLKIGSQLPPLQIQFINAHAPPSSPGDQLMTLMGDAHVDPLVQVLANPDLDTQLLPPVYTTLTSPAIPETPAPLIPPSPSGPLKSLFGTTLSPSIIAENFDDGDSYDFQSSTT